MKAADRALDKFHSLTRSLAEFSEKEQIVRLKTELLEALERADGFERDLECLEDPVDLGDAFDSLSMPRSLLQLQEVHPRRSISGSHAPTFSPRRALHELRLALLEMEWQCPGARRVLPAALAPDEGEWPGRGIR